MRVGKPQKVPRARQVHGGSLVAREVEWVRRRVGWVDVRVRSARRRMR